MAEGDADLIGFGRPYISNPDLVERMKNTNTVVNPVSRLLPP
ncbi:hypothetical protein GW590_13775 [Rahnella sp. SAP-1]|uniref:NADH:flavin oxidoreductase/NADH oxidase N-terminal domain-containing protein n=1 Tax=Rouxiella aceris TaxID=2703884 RepID=A0A848MP97_9GAMM|nr:hypothetical protein [Rouxiella aceris]